MTLGFMNNEYSYCINTETPIDPLIFEKDSNQRWVGEHYQLWPGRFMSWLYNDNDGSIIFEITPHYKFFFTDAFDPEAYAKWIKTYKPYYQTTLPHQTAQE